MTDLFDFADEYARRLRDDGMQQAADHANDILHGWTNQALDWIKVYSRTHAKFISEECTDAARAAGIPEPPDGRAWGVPFARAAKQNIIKRIGFGISKRRHLSPTPLWAAQTHRGE